jgi:hypothetical protein
LTCIEEYDEARTPVDQRTEQGLPCPKHGHPGTLWPENWLFVEMYHAMAGNMVYLPGQEKTLIFLSVPVVKILTDAYHVDFLEAWERLQIIHDELS